MKNLIPGMKVNNWTIIKDGYRRNDRPGFLCKCDCGIEAIVKRSDLIKAKSFCCSKCSIKRLRKHHIKIGDIFGHWEVIDDNLKKSKVLCICKCGTKKLILQNTLIDQYSTQCNNCRLTQVSKEDAAINAAFYDVKYRAKKKKVNFNITKEDFIKLSKENCHYCGDPPSNRGKKATNHSFIYSGLDRKDPKMGYIFSNIIPSCWICNRAKNNTPYEEFIAWIKQIDKHLIENNLYE